MVTDIRINPYYPEYKFRSVPDLDQQLQKDYDFIFHKLIDLPINYHPRLILELGKKIIFRDIYYSIDLLYENNPKSVVDIGCGLCHWKRYFPYIYGFDEKWYGDYGMQDATDFYDFDFAILNKKKYDCGMAINVFDNLSLENFASLVHNTMQIVRDRFLFTFSYNKQIVLIDEFTKIKKLLDKMPYKIVMFDFLTNEISGRPVHAVFEYFVNGNLKIILEHKNGK